MVLFLLWCWLVYVAFVGLCLCLGYFLLTVNVSLLQYLLFSLGGSSLKGLSSLPSWLSSCVPNLFLASPHHPVTRHLHVYSPHTHNRSSGAIKSQQNMQQSLFSLCSLFLFLSGNLLNQLPELLILYLAVQLHSLVVMSKAL